MNMHISEPVVVAVGADSRTGDWGAYQFPSLERLSDGRLAYSFNNCADSEAAYGSEPGFRISEDGGKTWQPANPADYAHLSGLPLPNGERISFVTDKSLPLDTVELPEPIGVSTLDHTIYRIEEVSPSFCPRGWILRRANQENPCGVREEVKLNWPHMIVRSCLGVFVPPSARGRLRIAPDGTLWMPHYYLAGADIETGEFIPHLCNYLFQSTDYGHTWDLVSFLPYYPDEAEGGQKLASMEGFGENDIAFTPDGSMIRLIRTHSARPSYYTRSEDGGKTWSEPTPFDSHGVWPCVITLGCGVTVASYGRPGIKLRVSYDPSAKEWEEPITLLTPPGGSWKGPYGIGTCGYTSMVALDEHTVGLAYSDFTHPDAEGAPRKTLMFRTVTFAD